MIAVRTYLLAILLTLAVAVISGRAFGHGDAQWIANGQYRGADGLICCGKNDCVQVPDDSVRATRGGYVFSLPGGIATVPFRDVLISEDEHFWICLRTDGTIRCVFAPPLGA